MSDLSGVTPKDIRDAAFGFTIPEGEDPAIQRLIDKAERKIAARVPNLAERIQPGGDIDKAAFVSLVEDMVLRVLNNPEGKKSERIDDYSYTVDDRVAAGFLYLTDEELEELLPGTQRTRAFGNIRLAVPSWRLPR